MEQPISSTPPPASESDFFDPRRQLGMQVFRWGLVPEFLLCGLIRHALDDGTFEWRLPEKGMVTASDIDSISEYFFRPAAYLGSRSQAEAHHRNSG